MFKLLCQSCGLKMHETATFLEVSPNTVKSWWLGNRNPPSGVLRELHKLRFAIRNLAHSLTSTDRLTDIEARLLGLPCSGSYDQCIILYMDNMPLIAIMDYETCRQSRC